jgi:hypothetical protein
MSQTSKTSQSETSEDEDDGTSSAGSIDSVYEKDDIIRNCFKLIDQKKLIIVFQSSPNSQKMIQTNTDI